MNKKLKLITIEKDNKIIKKSSEVSIRECNKLFCFIKEMFNNKTKPTFEDSKFLNDFFIINIQYEKGEELFLDKYIMSGVLLTKDNEIIIKLIEKDSKEIFFTTQKLLSEFQ